MKIEFYAKDVYGKTNLYIKDEEIAKKIGVLTRRKTIDVFEIQVLSNLFGCEFIEVIAPKI